MGSTISLTCCSTVEDNPNESSNETTSEQTIPLVYTYPAISQNVIPRNLSNSTLRIFQPS